MLKKGFRYNGIYYNITCLNSIKKLSRIGIIVQKKHGNAVQRNYEKRIIREFFRTYQLSIYENSDLIVVVKNSKGSFANKEKDFLNIISRINYEKK